MRGIYRIKECAETSQAVKSLNDQQQLRLNKMIRYLKRSETTTINMITTNQKQTFRNFHEKVFKSKLFYARMWDDKEMIRSLTAERGNHGCFGPDNDQAETMFLRRLKHRNNFPVTECGFSDISSESSELDEDDYIEAVSLEQKYSYQNEDMLKLPRGRRQTTTGINRQQLVETSLRPVTAIGSNVEAEFNVLPDIPGATTDQKFQKYFDQIRSEIVDIPARISVVGYSKEDSVLSSEVHTPHIPYKDKIGIHSDKHNHRYGLATSTPNKTLSDNHRMPVVYNAPTSHHGRPKTCSGTSLEKRHLKLEESQKPGDVLLASRRPSMFNRSCKSSKVEKLLLESKAVDYRPRVQQFCESLTPLINPEIKFT